MQSQKSGKSSETPMDAHARIAALEAELQAKEESLQHAIAELERVKSELCSRTLGRPQDSTDLPERTNRLAKIGGWELDLQNQQLTWSEETRRIHEVDTGFVPTLDQAMNFYAPESRLIIQAALRRGIESGTPWCVELPMITATGRYIWVVAQGKVEMQHGKAARLFGAIQDITERKQNEQAFWQSNERFAAAFEHAPIGIALVTPDGRFIKVNRAICDLVGYEPAELLEMAFQGITHPDDLESELEKTRRMLAGEITKFELEKRYIHKRGHSIIVLLSTSLVRDNLGQPCYFIKQIQDISARNFAEAALKESEARLREAQAIARVGSFHWNARTNLVSWSEETYRIYGQTPGEFEPSFESYISSIHAAERTQVERSLQEVIASKGEVDHEYRVIRPDGTIRDVHARVRAVVDENGVLSGLDGTCQDITDRKQKDEKLLASEARTRLMIQAASIGLWDWDLVTNAVYFSPEWKQQLGYEDNELPNCFSEWQSRLHPNDLENALQATEDFRYGKRSTFDLEFRLRHRDGSWRWIYAPADIHCDAAGNAIRMMGCHLDITDRKLAESVLRRSRQDLIDAQRIAHIGSWHLDFGSGEVVWSDELYRMYGFDPTLPPPPFAEHEKLFTADSWEKLSTAVPKTQDTGIPYELELEMLRIDGSHGWMWVRGEVVVDANGKKTGLRGVAQDITERKQAQAALQQSEARLGIVTGSARVGLVVADRERRYIFANAAYKSILNLPDQDIVGRPIADVLPDVYFQRIKPRLDRAFTGERIDYELQFPTEKGTAHCAVNYEPIFSENQVSSVVAVVMDVTAQRNMEEQLRQSQKMETVGQLAGGIAHDFNNLLTIISGYTDLLLMTHPKTDPAWDSLNEIRNASSRASDLTQRLLAFGRRKMRSPESLDLNAMILHTQTLLQRSVGEAVEIVVSLSENPQYAWMDRSELTQILLNLAINARDAMQNSGRLSIQTQNFEISSDEAAKGVGFKPGKYTLLTVSDSGCGMTADVQAKIFEPFFTTKPVGKGTGLGLAVVHGIISGSGGRIHVSSEVNIGTTFEVYLPQVTGSEVLPESTSTPEIPCGGTETILLVEDDHSIRRLSHAILTDYGYEVIEAANGQEAIDIFRNWQHPIHILVTDVIMPGLNGVVMAEQIMKLKPGLPVLFMSGYLGESDIRDRLKVMDLLHKPFKPNDLAHRVRKALDFQK